MTPTIREIKARKKFLKEVAHLSDIILGEIGTRDYYDEGSCHTHTKQHFDNGEFRIETDRGQSSMGGNDLVITFEGKTVLHVRWQPYAFDPVDCQVDEFDSSLGWQKKLRRIAENPKAFIDRHRKQRTKNLLAVAAAVDRVSSRSEEGKRLGFPVDAEFEN